MTTNEAAELFSAASAAAPVPVTVAEALQKKVQELRKAEEEVEELESSLKAAKARVHKINIYELPELMDQIGSTDFTVSAVEPPVRVTLERIVSGSLPKEDKLKQRAVLDRIRDLDGSHIIKQNVIVHFRASQENEAKSLAASLESAGFAVSTEAEVHPQTLAAFGRELLDRGEKVDPSEIGLFVGRKAKVKPLVEKKGKRR